MKRHKINYSVVTQLLEAKNACLQEANVRGQNTAITTGEGICLKEYKQLNLRQKKRAVLSEFLASAMLF